MSERRAMRLATALSVAKMAAASAAASQVAVEASKVDWAGLAEGALEQTVVFLVYVPVFAYTFAASLPAEEQFVLGLVVILIVGSVAKQDD